MIARSFIQRGGPVATLLASAALAGCTMAPTYERPAAPVSTAFPVGDAYEQAITPAEGQTAADIGWRDFFNDPLLQTLVERALDNNRDLRVSALNVESARAQYRIQRSELLPNLSIGGEGSAQHLPDPLFYNRRSYQVGASVSAWELDLWGRLRSLSSEALQKYSALAETRNAAQLSLVAEVANAYLTLRADQELLRLSRETLAAQQKSYDLTKQLVDVGNVAQLDLRRAEIALRTAESDMATYTRLAAQDRNALVLLLGEPLTPALARQLDAADTLADNVVPDSLPAGLPSDLLTRRPDIRAAEHMLRGANANIGAARAAFFPTISLTGSAGTASADLDGLFSSGSGAWSFLPRITMPIFRLGAIKANLDRAEVQKRIEIATYEKAIQSAFREVSDGLAGQGTLDEQIRAERLRAEASRKSYALSRQRYEAGEDGNLALLDAQRSLYGAEQSLVRARLLRLTNLINLYKALGGGWMERSATDAG
jgi:multidrug efflux system outer membrane protein